MPPGTPFPPGFTDLRSWARDQFLGPDWLRIGTDIVGQGAFNAAFVLNGVTVPSPSRVRACPLSWWLAVACRLGASAALLKALIDPNAAPVRALSREQRELMIAANNSLARTRRLPMAPDQRRRSSPRCWRSALSYRTRQEIIIGFCQSFSQRNLGLPADS